MSFAIAALPLLCTLSCAGNRLDSTTFFDDDVRRSIVSDTPDQDWTELDEEAYWQGQEGRAVTDSSPGGPYKIGLRDGEARRKHNQTSFTAAVLDRPFDEFSAQCSHNTYLFGLQSAGLKGLKKRAESVHEYAVFVALTLGYRCIEIDVWRREHPKILPPAKRWDGPNLPANMKIASFTKVAHKLWNGWLGSGSLTNSVDLTLFVQQILRWCEMDEKTYPATKLRPKLPIIISLENHASTKSSELHVKTVVGWLGDRIVLPNFHRGTPMSALTATSGKRKILLKATCSSKLPLSSIIALRPSQSGDTYAVKSIEMDPSSAKASTVHKIERTLHKGDLVRTYPSAGNWQSQNYNPANAFHARAHMVCVNFQGRCNSSEARCWSPERGQKRSQGCPCDRDFSASLESAFLRWGYDGYLHYPTLSDAAWRELRHLRS